MSASINQRSSPYSFQELYKSFDSKKKKEKTQSNHNMQKHLPFINQMAFSSLLSKTIIPSNSNTLDSNYYKVAKTLQSIRNRVKLSNQLQELPKTMQSYGGESISQLTERKKRKELLITNDNPPLTEFMSESKEICLKNLLIKIIQKESSKIEEREVNIGKALDIEQKNLNNDQYLFNEYSENKKKSFREIERQLLDIEKNNKMLQLKLKDIKQENENIQLEIQKYVSLIEKDRQYALFISRSLKGGKPELFRVEYKKANEVIKNYSMLLKQEMSYENILDDPTHLIKKAEELEALIVRFLLQKEEITIDADKIATEHQKALIDVSKREDELRSEYDKFANEYKLLTRDYNKLQHTTDNPLISDSEYSFLIQDLLQALTTLAKGSDTASSNSETMRLSQNRTKTILDLNRECNERLKNIEIKLNESIRRLVKYETDHKIFNSVLFKRKHVLKDIKQIEYKQKMESIVNRKREQAEERANRIIIKSRKTQAPFTSNKKVEHVFIDSNELKEIENNDLIHYH